MPTQCWASVTDDGPALRRRWAKFLLLFGRSVSSDGRILVQVTIYRRLRIGRDCHLDQSEAYDIS